MQRLALYRAMPGSTSIDLYSATSGSDQRGFSWPEQVASKELQLSDAAKAMLLSAHTPGYLLTQVPAGMLTQRLGAKRLLTLNTGGAAILLMLVPVAAARGGARGSRMHPAL